MPYERLEMRRPKAVTRAKRPLRLRGHAEQQLVEKARLNRHKEFALRLLAADEDTLRSVLRIARARVRTRRETEVCSLNYIERREALLEIPIERLAAKMVGDYDRWGRALRQCSPFAGQPFQ